MSVPGPARVAVAFVLLLVVSACVGCSNPPCGPSNCEGCCQADGSCSAGDQAEGCGTRGGACGTCGGTEQCVAGAQ
jgi:hypothetical protein